jgi:hypothetical protein
MVEKVFVKGHLNFSIDGQDVEHLHQNISVKGVTGLPWGKLNPKIHFGRAVTVKLRLPLPLDPAQAAPANMPPDVLTVTTPAHIMRESAVNGESMSLKFSMDAGGRAKLSALVQKSGHYPTEYIRKYPRIPSDSLIQTFPLRVVLITDSADGTFQVPIIFDLDNLSPNGVLIHTENQAALQLVPGAYVDLILEPRGNFQHPIRVQSLICRVSDEMSTINGNIIRYLGIKFTRFEEVDRAAFLELLKGILERIKSKPTE